MGFALKMTGMSTVLKTFKPIASSKTVIVAATAPYAEFVELGTSRMRAQPFARPGLTTAMAALGEIEQKSKSLNALVLLLAKRIASEWKKNAPVDTGELRNSIEVVSDQ